MSTEHFYPNPTTRRQLHVGPLACEIDGFASWLVTQGFAYVTGREKLRFIRDVSRWLEDHQVGVEVLDEQWAETFLRHRNRKLRGDASTCRELFGYLRERGRIPPVNSDRRIIGPLERIERAYERFLISERGLTSATVDNYLPTVRAFLLERFADEQVQFGLLVPQDANRFILRRAQRVSQSRAKLMVTALRSFLGFLHQRGIIGVDLAGAVLPVMHWRLTTLPKSLSPEQVESLLASCERSTLAGRRDYAILLLMARLGLRAGEVVAMVLEDLDWEAGVLSVHGKGQRQEALPLPHEVGQALVSYLREGRPTCTSRRLFVRLKAPYCGFSGPAAICDVVRRALARAKIDPPFKGSHLLRHSLACEMLRHGASLEDIGQILRHRHPETTQIYAKVDLEGLHALAPPWPGGAT